LMSSVSSQVDFSSTSVSSETSCVSSSSSSLASTMIDTAELKNVPHSSGRPPIKAVLPQRKTGETSLEFQKRALAEVSIPFVKTDVPMVGSSTEVCIGSPVDYLTTEANDSLNQTADDIVRLKSSGRHNLSTANKISNACALLDTKVAEFGLVKSNITKSADFPLCESVEDYRPSSPDYYMFLRDGGDLLLQHLKNGAKFDAIVKQSYPDDIEFLFAPCSICVLDRTPSSNLMVNCFLHQRCRQCYGFLNINVDPILKCGPHLGCKDLGDLGGDQKDRPIVRCAFCRSYVSYVSDQHCGAECKRLSFCRNCRCYTRYKEDSSGSYVCDDGCEERRHRTRVCTNFTRGRCHRGNCKFLHSMSADGGKAEQKKKVSFADNVKSESEKTSKVVSPFEKKYRELLNDYNDLRDELEAVKIDRNQHSLASRNLTATLNEYRAYHRKYNIDVRSAPDLRVIQHAIHSVGDPRDARDEKKDVRDPIIPIPPPNDEEKKIKVHQEYRSMVNLNFHYVEVLDWQHCPWLYYIFRAVPWSKLAKHVVCRYKQLIERKTLDERPTFLLGAKMEAKDPWLVEVELEFIKDLRVFGLCIPFSTRVAQFYISYEAYSNFIRGGVLNALNDDWKNFENLMYNERLSTGVNISRFDDFNIVPNTKIVAYHYGKFSSGRVFTLDVPDKPFFGELDGGVPPKKRQSKSGSTVTSVALRPVHLYLITGTAVYCVLRTLLSIYNSRERLDFRWVFTSEGLRFLSQTCGMKIMRLLRLLLALLGFLWKLIKHFSLGLSRFVAGGFREIYNRGVTAPAVAPSVV